MEDKNKSPYLCSPIRKCRGFVDFLVGYFFPFRIESLRNRPERKNEKNFEKSLAVKNKPLTFAPAFETKRQVLWNIDKQYK